jgi:hypothetical protein
MGAPATLVREITDEDLQQVIELHGRYKRRSLEYLELGLGAELPR